MDMFPSRSAFHSYELYHSFILSNKTLLIHLGIVTLNCCFMENCCVRIIWCFSKEQHSRLEKTWEGIETVLKMSTIGSQEWFVEDPTVIPAQSSDAKCGHMGAAMIQRDAKASSNSTLCRTTRDEACYCEKSKKKLNLFMIWQSTEEMITVDSLRVCWSGPSVERLRH